MELSAQLKKDGYCIFQLLEKEDIAFLNSLCTRFLQTKKGEFISSSAFLSSQENDYINEELHSKIAFKFSHFFPELQLLGGTLATKRMGNNYLDVHRDWNIVDEEKFVSYNLWVPLVDTGLKNGTLGIVKGSHLNCNEERGFNIPNPFLSKTKKFIENSVEPILKAGEAILYDHRLLHFSRPNKTKIERNVAILGVKTTAAELRVSLLNNNTIECYAMSKNDFYSFDAERIRKENKLIYTKENYLK